MNKMYSAQNGFALFETLLVIAAIGILTAITILAINPTKKLSDTKNIQRKVDINTILNTIYQYAIDNNGVIPPTVLSTNIEICKTSAVSCSGLVDLAVLTTSSKYIVSMPVDPLGGSTNGTGYFIQKTINNRITISAPHAENGATITVTR